jgi:putative sugar O-methyltransferase
MDDKILNNIKKFKNNNLNVWRPSVDLDIDSYKPWTNKGKFFLNFSKNFYECLKWYKIWKIKNISEKIWLSKKNDRTFSIRFKKILKYALTKTDDKNICKYLNNYNLKYISDYTKLDFLIQNITGKKIDTILDFGSGIGRMPLVWYNKNNTIISVDTTNSLYILQYYIYNLIFKKNFIEYFKKKSSRINYKKKILHIPVNKLSLIKKKSVDLIICIQVLNEINDHTVNYVINNFKRIIKKEGLLYIRDNEFGYKPANSLNLSKILIRNGFKLIYKHQCLEQEIEGKPRLWLYKGEEEVSKYFKIKYKFVNFFKYPNNNFNLKVFINVLKYRFQNMFFNI